MPSRRLALLTPLLLFAAAGAAPPRPTEARLTARPGPDSALLAKADAGRIQGSPSAKVWLIEASDFQCPYCKEWHDESFATVIKQYVTSGKVRFAFLNDPLAMHDHSVQAAEAAMCASVQDKFWPMHEALFGSQASWENLPNPAAYFDSLAVKKVGVDAASWRACVKAHTTMPLIDADRARLKASGVEATPTFFVGGLKLEGVQSLAELRGALDAALAKAGGP